MTPNQSGKHAKDPGPNDGPGDLLGKSAAIDPLVIPDPDRVLPFSRCFAYLSKTQVRRGETFSWAGLADDQVLSPSIPPTNQGTGVLFTPNEDAAGDQLSQIGPGTGPKMRLS